MFAHLKSYELFKDDFEKAYSSEKDEGQSKIFPKINVEPFEIYFLVCENRYEILEFLRYYRDYYLEKANEIFDINIRLKFLNRIISELKVKKHFVREAFEMEIENNIFFQTHTKNIDTSELTKPVISSYNRIIHEIEDVASELKKLTTKPFKNIQQAVLLYLFGVECGMYTEMDNIKVGSINKKKNIRPVYLRAKKAMEFINAEYSGKTFYEIHLNFKDAIEKLKFPDPNDSENQRESDLTQLIDNIPQDTPLNKIKTKIIEYTINKGIQKNHPLNKR